MKSGQIKTEAAIWAEGTEYTAAELVSLYQDHVTSRRESGEVADSPARFFGSFIENYSDDETYVSK